MAFDYVELMATRLLDAVERDPTYALKSVE